MTGTPDAAARAAVRRQAQWRPAFRPSSQLEAIVTPQPPGRHRLAAVRTVAGSLTRA
ncbi:MAG: hypothetical protein ACTHMZ_15785 [Actinomycetes bacterium]